MGLKSMICGVHVANYWNTDHELADFFFFGFFLCCGWLY